MNTPEEVQRGIAEMRAQGAKIREITERFKISVQTVYRVIDPAKYQKHCEGRRKRSRKRRQNEKGNHAGAVADHLSVKYDAFERMKLIPQHDPRDLTGVMFGDPIKGDPRRPWCPWLKGE